MHLRQGLTFDDVLLVPKHSTLRTRKQVNIGVDLGKNVRLAIPLISANMKSVTEAAMAQAVGHLGGFGLLHRFMPVEDQVQMWRQCRKTTILVGASVGVKPEEIARADALANAGCRVICVDVAHGDSEGCVRMVQYISTHHPHVLIIAGNVATADGAMRLYEAGADVIKVGVGPGSLCTTRIETGNGMPQLTALMDVAQARKEANAQFTIIADGGIKNAGDMVKALCLADAVMLGNLLAGTDESPGELIAINDQKYKQYNGSSTHKPSHIEGVTAMVSYRGPVVRVITKLMEGLRSGCSYQGAHDLNDLKKGPEFVLISHAGLTESHPHNVILN